MTVIEAHFAARFGDLSLDATFTVPYDGVSSIFGPSGSGKTTILNCLAGLIRPAVGRLIVNGEAWQDQHRFVPAFRRRIGYVFQGANLFPHLSVADNLRYGLKRRTVRNDGRLALGFDEVMAMLGLETLAGRMPVNLSGGEAQRVAIARALLRQPELLLLDEPLAGLDRASRNEIIAFLEQVQTRLAIPVILVSHDLDEVIRFADRLIRLEAGRVLGVGPLEECLLRLDLPFAHALDASSLLGAAVCDYDAQYGLAKLEVDGGFFEVPMAAAVLGTRLRLRVFASDVAIGHTGAGDTTILNSLPARIVEAAPGELQRMNVVLKLGSDGHGASILARVTRKSWDKLALQPGAAVFALVKAVSLACA